MRKLLWVMVAALLSISAFAGDNSEKATAFKAEFIVDLLENVEWTESNAAAGAGQVSIYVVGDCPVNEKLRELAAAESKDGKSVEVTVVSSADEIEDADIVFVATGDLDVLAKVLKKIKGKSVLTVADAKDFARYGVMINFFEEEGSSEVKYEVNTLVLDSVGVKLSSKLMKKASLI
ncbi:MAG: YfiR family protein [Candidatus Zixiibacteriota bacterium]|nr:MAG: YfiR family protein [candidate division Zixibacteria bacterium]